MRIIQEIPSRILEVVMGTPWNPSFVWATPGNEMLRCLQKCLMESFLTSSISGSPWWSKAFSRLISQKILTCRNWKLIFSAGWFSSFAQRDFVLSQNWEWRFVLLFKILSETVWSKTYAAVLVWRGEEKHVKIDLPLSMYSSLHLKAVHEWILSCSLPVKYAYSLFLVGEVIRL